MKKRMEIPSSEKPMERKGEIDEQEIKKKLTMEVDSRFILRIINNQEIRRKLFPDITNALITQSFFFDKLNQEIQSLQVFNGEDGQMSSHKKEDEPQKKATIEEILKGLSDISSYEKHFSDQVEHSLKMANGESGEHPIEFWQKYYSLEKQRINNLSDQDCMERYNAEVQEFNQKLNELKDTFDQINLTKSVNLILDLKNIFEKIREITKEEI